MYTYLVLGIDKSYFGIKKKKASGSNQKFSEIDIIEILWVFDWQHNCHIFQIIWISGLLNEDIPIVTTRPFSLPCK